jgi:hypothetical protein
MINKDSLNYGALYSFEPEFLRHVTEDETPILVEDTATYHLDKTDTKWSGVLVILVFIVLIILMISLTAAVGRGSIERLTASNIYQVPQHY